MKILEKPNIEDKKMRIFVIVLLFVSIFFIFLGARSNDKNMQKAKNLKTFILESSKEEKQKAYVDVITKPYLFATYETNSKEDENKFYLVMDKDNYLYIIYIDDDTYNKLNNDKIKEKAIRVSGFTKKISVDMKKKVIDSYNKAMEDEYLNDDNFSKYVGFLYLDTKEKAQRIKLEYVLASLSFLLSLTIGIRYVVNLKNKKCEKKTNSIKADRNKKNKTIKRK